MKSLRRDGRCRPPPPSAHLPAIAVIPEISGFGILCPREAANPPFSGIVEKPLSNEKATPLPPLNRGGKAMPSDAGVKKASLIRLGG